MAMSYGYVYVAQVAIGANQNQYIKALEEAENYKGPSLIIAYSTCINQGMKKGMSYGLKEQKEAVEAGYWSLYRYNPMLENEGKNPFVLDSKEPDWNKFNDSSLRIKFLYPQSTNIEDLKSVYDGASGMFDGF